jgi:RND family efflux transporter MFP subunit
VHLVVQTVQNIHVVPSIRTAGKLASKVEFKLSYKTGGIIEEIYIEEGEKVKRGQPLATLALSEIQSRVNQARLSVSKAERDYQRARNLYQDSVVTLELFQNATTALEVAKSDLRIAEFNLNHSKIMAPSNGLILKKLAEENEIVGPGQPVFYYASTESAWIMRVNVTDKDRVHLNLLDSAILFFDAFPDRHIKAEVSEIAEIADPYTGTFEVELSLIDQVQTPVSGLIGTALIYPSYKIDLPIIPYDALMEGNGMTGQVWIIQNGLPEKHRIEIFSLHDMGILVRNGLSAGDSIVVEGGQYIRNDYQIIIDPNVQEDTVE